MATFSLAGGLQLTLSSRCSPRFSKNFPVKHTLPLHQQRIPCPVSDYDSGICLSDDSDDEKSRRLALNARFQTTTRPATLTGDPPEWYHQRFIPGPSRNYTASRVAGRSDFLPPYLRHNVFDQEHARFFEENPEAAPLIALRSRTLNEVDRAVTVLCLSNLYLAGMPHLPEADILVLAGGLTDGEIGSGDARLYELHALVHSRKFQHIIVIGRGTDTWLDPRLDEQHRYNQEGGDDGPTARNLREMITEYQPTLVYLKDTCATLVVRGRVVKIVGMPGAMTTNDDSDAAFPYHPNQAANMWNNVPDGVDILVTWTPPAGYLDGGNGDAELEKCLWEKRPRAVIFGHPESERGLVRMKFDEEHREYQKAIADYIEEMDLAQGVMEQTGVVLEVPRIRPPLWDVPIPPEWTPGENDAILVNASYSEEDEELEIDPILIRI